MDEIKDIQKQIKQLQERLVELRLGKKIVYGKASYGKGSPGSTYSDYYRVSLHFTNPYDKSLNKILFFCENKEDAVKKITDTVNDLCGLRDVLLNEMEGKA